LEVESTSSDDLAGLESTLEGSHDLLSGDGFSWSGHSASSPSSVSKFLGFTVSCALFELPDNFGVLWDLLGNLRLATSALHVALLVGLASKLAILESLHKFTLWSCINIGSEQ
jgi:hypothetical protein